MLQLVATAPGERITAPGFGCGVTADPTCEETHETDTAVAAG